jgi:hypothetical protein
MAKTNYGFGGVNSNLNPQLSSSPNQDPGNLNSARVISVVLDSTHPRFTELGGYAALGAIEYDLVSSAKYNLEKYPVAYPLNSNHKHIPLINEIVEIKSAFSNAVNTYEKGLNIIGGESRKYYSSGVSVWNHPHHNAYSFKINDSPASQNKNYNQTEVGSPSVISNEPAKIYLGKTFNERDVNPLLPFEGDIIYEGRWGNTIRLGSTVMASASFSPNDWSTEGVGQNGDPIIVIKNGQGNTDKASFEPIIENINDDLSNIYLTSTQKIPIKNNDSYVSYNEGKAPDAPDQYAGPQIILDSGRLYFHTWSDHILLSSAKSINFNAKESVNIDTIKFITQADKIFLGKEDQATEPLLLGDTTVQVLKDLTSAIRQLTNIIATLQSDPVVQGSPATFATLNGEGVYALTSPIRMLLDGLDVQMGTSPANCTLTSKRNFTV